MIRNMICKPLIRGAIATRASIPRVLDFVLVPLILES